VIAEISMPYNRELFQLQYVQKYNCGGLFMAENKKKLENPNGGFFTPMILPIIVGIIIGIAGLVYFIVQLF
jgi:hypothetical protein